MLMLMNSGLVLIPSGEAFEKYHSSFYHFPKGGVHQKMDLQRSQYICKSIFW